MEPQKTPWVVLTEFEREGVIVKVERMAPTPPYPARYSLTVGSRIGLKFSPHIHFRTRGPKDSDTRIGWITAELVEKAVQFIREQQRND